MQSLAITKKGSSWAQWAVRAFVLFVSTEKMGVEVHSKLKKKLKRTLKNPRGHVRLHFSAVFSLDGVYYDFNITFLSSLSHATHASN